MPELADALRSVGGSQILAMFSTANTRAAAEMERLRFCGRSCGLTDAEITEVVDTWLAWYRERPYPTSLPRIRDAVIARCGGADWRPPADPPRVDQQFAHAVLHALGVPAEQWANYYERGDGHGR